MSDPRSREMVINQREHDKKIDAIKLCGVNRGPHRYEPIAWKKDDKEEHVKILMCMVCFTRVDMKTLYEQFPEAKV